MDWLHKTFQQFGRLSIDTQALIISLILVLTSLSFSFLLDRNDLSIKDKNISLIEAQSIIQGKITLPQREHDAAIYQDRILNVFQPGQTIFFIAHLMVTGGNGGTGKFQLEIFLFFILTVFLFSIAIYRLTNGQIVLSVCIVASFMFGAPYIANLPLALDGSVYRVNHILAILFMVALLFVVSSPTFDKKLILAGACIGAAMLFRLQNALLLLLPLSILLQDSDGNSWELWHRLSTSATRKQFVIDVVHCWQFLLSPVSSSQNSKIHLKTDTCIYISEAPITCLKGQIPMGYSPCTFFQKIYIGQS
jgi:hypothetical protein